MRTPGIAIAALACLLVTAGPARGLATKGFVLTTDYASGTLGVVDLASRAVTPDVADVSPDPVERWFRGLLYVVNRLGYDNVQVIDPAQGYQTVRQFSVGNGTNPQDIALAAPTKAYVSRLGTPDLLIVNPATGASLGTISLAPWADGDGNPEAAHMTIVGRLLFVALERLANFAPADTGLVVVIDTQADTVFDADPSTPGKQVVRLPGKNPHTAFARLLVGAPFPDTHLYIGCVGAWGALDGGVADIVVPGFSHGQPAAITCGGYAITEAALGGDVVDVDAWGPTHSYAIVSDASYNTSLVSWNPSSGVKLGTLYAPGGYSLTDAALDDRGELYVCNSSFTAPGLHVFRAGTDTRLAGPLDTGLPPVQIVFDEYDGSVAVGDPQPGERLALSPPAPYPARVAARLTLSLPERGRARVEVFDAAGRSVRLLADGVLPAGGTALVWDLADAGGRAVRPGLYFVTAVTAVATVSRRVAVLN